MVTSTAGVVRITLRILVRNRITVYGVSFALFSVATLFLLSVLEISGIIHSPYVGILAFLIMPAFMLFGIAVFVVGLFLRPRRRRLWFDFAPDTGHEPPHIDLKNPRTRQIIGMAGFLSGVNLFIFGVTGYHGVVYMDSVEFCGKVCHTVMEPEYTAFLDSPHSHVECVQCHVGSGAEAFVQAKLAGLRQVAGVTFGTYERPIPPPHQSLRPAQETCEKCHAPEGAFSGDTVCVYSHFADDAANTPQQTVLVMHMGTEYAGNGIHSWHLAPGREITYEATDDARQKITKVTVKEADGTTTDYLSTAETALPEPDSAPAATVTRKMDCLDCHNRPSHGFQMPAEAVDRALTSGKLDRTLPYVRKLAVEALTQTKGVDGDLDTIAQYVVSHFKSEQPDVYEARKKDLAKAVGQIQDLYKRNVFPKMNVSWGTYINNNGHVQFEGCFRCHDDAHVSNTGLVISQDCTSCHGVLAMEETNPQVLTDLGIAAPAATDTIAKAMQ